MTTLKRILDVFSFWCHIAEKCEAELPTVTKKSYLLRILKGIRKYESASKKYDFSVIQNRMLPPFISDRKSKHPTYILA